MSKNINKNVNKKFSTDKQTDYLFDYFINEDKFDEQLRPVWDEEMQNKLGAKLESHKNHKLDSRIVTEAKKNSSGNKKISEDNISSEKEEEELPSHSIGTSNNKEDMDVDFDNSDTETEKSQSSVKSIYGKKIEATQLSQEKPQFQSEKKLKSENKKIISEKPLLADKLIDNVQKYIETPEQKRARQRETYSKLQDLVKKYNIKLSRDYTIDSDPDEMEAEYIMHKEQRNKTNQVKFYKSILLNVICGIEFLNEKYDPFAFKLKDWSKQIAADIDDYTEVLEDLYEKYKDKGGKMSPEIKLLFMIIMSGVTYHLSQALFGSSGLGNTIKNNPNILGKLLGGFMKGNNNNNENEKIINQSPSPNNKDILEKIRNFNKNKTTETATEVTTKSIDKSVDENNAKIDYEKEKKKLLDEQKAQFEAYKTQLETMKNQYERQLQNSQQFMNEKNQKNINQQFPNSFTTENIQKNQLLSDSKTIPRFYNNQELNKMSDNNINNENIFDTEIEEQKEKISPKKSDKIDEIIESLDIDSNEIVQSSKKKSSKPITSSSRKYANSSTRSARKTATEHENRKKEIIKL